MTALKSFTDIPQSKKLAEILPLESADMCYVIDYAESNKYGTDHFKLEVDTYGLKVKTRDNIPCWSLAALEYLIWNISVDAVSCPYIYKNRIANGYYILYGNHETNICSSMVDACYELILKLHKLNML